MIRTANTEDAAQICDIYNHYVQQTTITFEEQAVAPEEMEQRITEVRRDLAWLVWEEGGAIIGFAYASKWKGRCAYRYSVESTVYVQSKAQGRGVGGKLYQELLSHLHDLGMHTVLAGIALPNEASIALHKKLGFEKIAHFKEVGWKFKKWIDVGYWQLLMSADLRTRIL
ncbi:MAG: arsinothricin resistance N-acetyltransferase ArsN1 family B [Silvibacterium sp.]